MRLMFLLATLFVCYATCPYVLADDKQQSKHSFGTSFTGKLDPPDSPTYIASRETVKTYELPGGDSRSHFALQFGQQVKALGIVHGSRLEADAAGRDPIDWVEVETDDQNVGFVLSTDVLSPNQFRVKREMDENKKVLSGYFDRAQNASGALAKYSGVYSSVCSAGRDLKRETLSMFSILLAGRELFWTEGDTLYRLMVMSPTIRAYTIAAADPVSFPKEAGEEWGGGTKISMFRLTPVSADTKTEYLGFYGNKIYYLKDGKNYGKLARCESSRSERYNMFEIYLPRAIEEYPRHSK